MSSGIFAVFVPILLHFTRYSSSFSSVSSSQKMFSNTAVITSNIATVLSAEDTRRSPKTLTLNNK